MRTLIGTLSEKLQNFAIDVYNLHTARDLKNYLLSNEIVANYPLENGVQRAFDKAHLEWNTRIYGFTLDKNGLKNRVN